MNNSPIWHPFTQHAASNETIEVKRASGAYVYTNKSDQAKERRIIDAISSWWVITHGHCHPYISQSVQEQAEKLDQVIFAGFTHEQAEKLAARMMELSKKSFDRAFDHAFFSDSGSTSVEVALKMAIGYWVHKGKSRSKIISLEDGYHGDTFGAMSVGGRNQYNALYKPFLFETEHLPVPEKGMEARTMEHLETYLKKNGNEVAAFIFEPLLMGAGGMKIYSPEALKQMADMCREYDILLIADEVMTGFGRTGTMFACEQAGVMPDIMCLSKGMTGGFLPMGLTLCNSDIFKAYYHEDRAKMFFHSTSFTGNALSCAAANASLDIWEKEPVFKRIANIENAHKNAIAKLSQHNNIANIRQKGIVLALDIMMEDEKGGDYLSNIQPRLYNLALENNVLLRPLGNTIYVLPPYCVSSEDLQEIYTAIGKMASEI